MTHPNSLKNLRLYQPGVSGNPGGKQKLPPELRGIKSLSQDEVTKLISKYARMSLSEVDTHLLEKKITVLELAFCSIFKNSIDEGDFTRIAFLLDRSIGKVKEIEENDEEREEREQLGKLSLNELLTLVKTNLPESPEAS